MHCKAPYVALRIEQKGVVGMKKGGMMRSNGRLDQDSNYIACVRMADRNEGVHSLGCRLIRHQLKYVAPRRVPISSVRPAVRNMHCGELREFRLIRRRISVVRWY